jgi:excisionase family DNA binding protein
MVRTKMVQVEVEEEKPTLAERGLRPLAVNIETAGELLSISRTQAYRLIKDGELKTVNIGTKMIVPVTEIQRFLDAKVA